MPRSRPPDPATPAELAERVRRRCIAAARAAWEDAGLQGLCAEGRWEAALGAMQRLDLGEPLRDEGGTHRTS